MNEMQNTTRVKNTSGHNWSQLREKNESDDCICKLCLLSCSLVDLHNSRLLKTLVGWKKKEVTRTLLILNENSKFRTLSFIPSNWHLIAVVFSVVILMTLFVSQSPLLYSTLHLLTSPLQRWKELFPLYLRLHLLALQVCAPLSWLNVRVQVQFPCLQICSFKLPVWQTGRYYCRIPDDPTLSLTNNHDGENNKVDPQILLNQSTPMHNS